MTNIYNSIIQLASMAIGLLLFIVIMPIMGMCILLIWGFGDGVVFERIENIKSGRELLFFRIENNYVKEKLHQLDLLALPQLFQIMTGELILIPLLQKEPQSRGDLQNPDGWLRTGSFLIPRQYRKPMLGDLIQDREEMRAARTHCIWIELATFFQLLIACASRPKLWISGLVGWFARSFLS